MASRSCGVRIVARVLNVCSKNLYRRTIIVKKSFLHSLQNAAPMQAFQRTKKRTPNRSYFKMNMKSVQTLKLRIQAHLMAIEQASDTSPIGSGADVISTCHRPGSFGNLCRRNATVLSSNSTRASLIRLT